METRNAILLSGFARDYKKTIEKFKKNLRTNENVDLFICFWDEKGIKKKAKHPTIKKNDGQPLVMKIYDSADFIDVEKIKEDYNPTKIKIFDIKFITSIITPLAEVIEKSDLTPTGQKFSYHIARTSLMFFMINQTFKLMKENEIQENILYKNVARVRTDFVQRGYYPKINWDKDYSDAIYVGNWNWSGVGKFKLNDHFAISSKEKMGIYCNFYNNLVIPASKFKTNEFGSTVSKNKTKAWSPEHSLSIYLHEKGIKWRSIS
jgi:hypothetical protein